MKLKNLIIVASASLASLFLSGCYIPQGTKRITGATGVSLFATSPSGETKIQTTVDLKLDGEPNAAVGGVTYGTVKIQDLGNGFKLDGTVVGLAPYNNGILGDAPGYSVYCVGIAKRGSLTLPVAFYVGVQEVSIDSTPGAEAKRLSNDKLAVQVLEIFEFGNNNPVYSSYAYFSGGNFVYHGSNGVILR